MFHILIFVVQIVHKQQIFDLSLKQCKKIQIKKSNFCSQKRIILWLLFVLNSTMYSICSHRDRTKQRRYNISNFKMCTSNYICVLYYCYCTGVILLLQLFVYSSLSLLARESVTVTSCLVISQGYIFAMNPPHHASGSWSTYKKISLPFFQCSFFSFARLIF